MNFYHGQEVVFDNYVWEIESVSSDLVTMSRSYFSRNNQFTTAGGVLMEARPEMWNRIRPLYAD